MKTVKRPKENQVYWKRNCFYSLQQKAQCQHNINFKELKIGGELFWSQQVSEKQHSLRVKDWKRNWFSLPTLQSFENQQVHEGWQTKLRECNNKIKQFSETLAMGVVTRSRKVKNTTLCLSISMVSSYLPPKKVHVCCQSDFTRMKIATNIVYRVRESFFDRNMNKWWGEPQKGIVSRNQMIAFVFELLGGPNTLKDWGNCVLQKNRHERLLDWRELAVMKSVTSNSNYDKYKQKRSQRIRRESQQKVLDFSASAVFEPWWNRLAWTYSPSSWYSTKVG